MPASAPLGAMRQTSQVKNKDIVEIEVDVNSMGRPKKDPKINTTKSNIHSTINVTKFSDT